MNTKPVYALAVSGGIDSMVMLHIFANEQPRKDFFVVTVNHNIRPEAQSDCDFVAEYCAKLGVTCKVFSVNVPEHARVNKLSEETSARILRYEVFNNLSCDYVCLAHQADDNAETVLMHILRGSGAYGAEGIKKQGERFIRPILSLTRADVESYAKQHNVPFVTDSTNSDVRYTRNFIRNVVIPQVTNVYPNAVSNINRFAENIATDNAYLDSLADIGTVVFCNDSAVVPLQLVTQPRPVAYRVLRKVFNKLGAWHDVEKTHFDAVIDLANNNGGKKLCLPFDLIAVNDYNSITIYKNTYSCVTQFEVAFSVGTTVTPLGNVTVSNTISNGLRIDIDKIPPTAVFRTRRQGDTFTKFGGGTKSLNKYLINKKIPLRERDNLLLVCNGSEVLVIVGVEISDKVKAEGTPYYIQLTKEI